MRLWCILISLMLSACGIQPQQAEVISGFSQTLQNSSENAAQALQWHRDNSLHIKLVLSALDENKQALNCQARTLNLPTGQCTELQQPISDAMLQQRLQVLETCRLYAQSLAQLIEETDLQALNHSLLKLHAAIATHDKQFTAGQQQALASLSTQITGWFVARERYELAQQIIREVGPVVNQMLSELSADLVLTATSGERGFIDSHQRLAQNLLDETQQRLTLAANQTLTQRSWLFEQQYWALHSLQRIENESDKTWQQMQKLHNINQGLIEKIQQQNWDKKSWLALGKEIQQLNSALQVSGVLNE